MSMSGVGGCVCQKITIQHVHKALREQTHVGCVNIRKRRVAEVDEFLHSSMGIEGIGTLPRIHV